MNIFLTNMVAREFARRNDIRDILAVKNKQSSKMLQSYLF